MLKTWLYDGRSFDAYDVPRDCEAYAFAVARNPSLYGLAFASVVGGSDAEFQMSLLKAEPNEYGMTHMVYSEGDFIRRFIDPGHAY